MIRNILKYNANKHPGSRAGSVKAPHLYDVAAIHRDAVRIEHHPHIKLIACRGRKVCVSIDGICVIYESRHSPIAHKGSGFSGAKIATVSYRPVELTEVFCFN